MNYKLTLAFTNVGARDDDDDDDASAACLGGMMDVTIYRPLPHTGLGLSVSSWGKEIGCDDVVALGFMTTVEVVRANANGVEDAIEEDREGVEPDSR